MDANYYDGVAEIVWKMIEPLDPFHNPDDVAPFGLLRDLTAKLTVLFEDADPTRFDAGRFIDIAMTGHSIPKG